MRYPSNPPNSSPINKLETHLDLTPTDSSAPTLATAAAVQSSTMTDSEAPLIDMSVIESSKENIQSLPSGRSARHLVDLLSPNPSTGKPASPCADGDTQTLNTALRAEYEKELLTLTESDDPLDIFDRYVRWTLQAYPSAQNTAQSGLQPLLERATKTFLNAPHYKNDIRYLKLWLHYIHLFSDSPRETYSFLSRHKIGECLAFFYEEFAAWLEGQGRWAQADEVYALGVEKEARPMERLGRRWEEMRRRKEAKEGQEGEGPHSPALRPVRQALGVKMDPFAPAASPAAGTQRQQQGQRPGSGSGAANTSRSGKPKMAIFSDSGAEGPPVVTSSGTKGWESIGSLKERKKENTIEAKPWVGETLKTGKQTASAAPKMTIFKDEVSSEFCCLP